LFARIGILDSNRADRAVLRGFENLLLAVARRIDRLRLAVVVNLNYG
jgi:hypothetical protein